MSRAVIITCAVTGGAPLSGKNKAVPVAPKEIAESAIAAGKAGAAIAHIHVREPESGRPSMRFELYQEVVDRIRQSGSDILINLTTGAGARFVPGEPDPKVAGDGSTLTRWEERVAHVLRINPDICSLDVGSMNFGEQVFVNTPAHLRSMAAAIKQSGTKPELEVFELGHIRLAKHLIERGLINTPALFQLCLGIPWGAPATPETMLVMRNQLPQGVIWAGFGIGAAQFPMAAQAVLLGGHTRVGLEDNLYLRHGVPAASNAALVEEAVRIIAAFGEHPASPAEASDILQLKSGTAFANPATGIGHAARGTE
jgi:uncharacterized protein (DUF849 family)